MPASPTGTKEAALRPTETAAALELRSVTKRYPGVLALQDVSLRLNRHEVVGLVGENGAGKSTLISIVNGTVRPDEGSIAIGGEPAGFGHPTEAARHGVATVFQEQGLVPTLAVYENLFLGREHDFTVGGLLRRKRLVALAQDVLAELGIDVDPTAYTASLSFAHRQLVEIAKAFALTRVYPVEPVILLDEPTSALSDRETEMLFASIARWREKGSFIFVSHRLSDIFAVCDRIAVLKDGRLTAELDASETDEASLHELMVGRKREAEYYREGRQRTPGERALLRAVDLARQGVFEEVALELREGEILGIAGVLGSGKSELARVLSGVDRADRGWVEFCGRRLANGSLRDAMRQGIGFVPAERSVEGIIGTHTVEWNLTLSILDGLRYPRSPFLDASRSRKVTEEWIDRLGIRTRGPKANAGHLSGGNQQKIVFAKWLARRPRVLVLDDPGRGVDVGAKEAMYELLRELAETGVGIVLVSDNLPELIGLSNRLLVLRDGGASALVDAPSHSKPREADVVKEMV